ncbi:MAG: hypothetical protein JXA75_02105 [Candidatus Thermoplasmatota archaeon]|nr:hypothetical protein [Candidatus Thermoplasmatota archaeon]
MNKRKLIIFGIVGIVISSGTIVGGILMYFPSVHLPGEPITMKVYDGSVSYFDIYLFDVPKGLDVTNGYYVGWCADRSVMMPRTQNLTVRLYNSYDLLLPFPLRDKDWDKVNYILNHKGDAAKEDIQDAFWHLLNDYPYEALSDTAKLLVDTAPDGYVPHSGDLLAVLAEPVRADDRPWPFQFAFIQVMIPPQEGKSHGFWKTHPRNWPSEYTPTMLVVDVFENASLYGFSSDTLQDALEYGGGEDLQGAAEILLRNAVASVLNAAHPNVNYPVLLDDLIGEVNEALGSMNRTTMLTLEVILDEYNNLEADLSD